MCYWSSRRAGPGSRRRSSLCFPPFHPIASHPPSRTQGVEVVSVISLVIPVLALQHSTTQRTLLNLAGPYVAHLSILTARHRATHSQDTDYPVRELLFHSPNTRGWQTPR